MQKNYFHNKKLYEENVNIKRKIKTQYSNKKITVDINKLLNRVKIDKRKELKKKIIFFSTIIIMLIFISTFTIIIK